MRYLVHMKAGIKRKLSVVLYMVAIAAVTGPFDTFQTLGLMHRIAYWGVSIVAISAFMIVAIEWFGGLPALRRFPVVAIVLGATAAGPFGAATVLALDVAFRGSEFTLYGLGFRWVFVSLVGIGVGIMEHYVRPRAQAREREILFSAARAEVAKSETASLFPEPGGANGAHDVPVSKANGHAAARPKEPPLFLRNLPEELGRSIISITTQDHYLDVVTEGGSDRILKRMSDAIAELNGYPGMQIHRSHWIAFDAVESLEREGRKVRVRLKNGEVLPVSRPNVEPLTKALEAG
ncbi:LytTR family DNA-binding domain-containing protein [Maritimibacter sp. DP1N21-5]|uniref:LytTR family DNA-binding domain-containing protein n=1 Tax=Maritimibacter sp. DP1N21-5 TaxID=2836867 RepID=UPI001C43BA4A|nr:LytTR family DNA-binding domain-containing protein [Maritimibacter sp. DP1N21-5]MBV7408428.1 LytTR family transcriptional regulator [Maritimibacter sp. DP1N21-5]